MAKKKRPGARPQMRYVLGQADPGEILANQRALAAMMVEIRDHQKREARTRTIMFAIGIVGALFAAVRLGVIAFPMVQQRRVARRAALGPPAPALGRRRRRSR